MLAPDLQPGELLALLDWSDRSEDALYLLTESQVRETWSDPQLPGGWDANEWTFGGWCRADPEAVAGAGDRVAVKCDAFAKAC